MGEIKYAIGVDISTQTVTATLIGVKEEYGAPAEIILPGSAPVCRPYEGERERRWPEAWLRLVRECIGELVRETPEARLAESIGVSTTFPGVFPIFRDGSIDPAVVSLYDNTDDVGACRGDFDHLLARAERETLGRVWPGNAAIGLARLVVRCGLKLDEPAAIVPPNTAFAHALLHSVGIEPDPADLISDFTQTAISGIYHARTSEPAPDGVVEMLRAIAPEAPWELLKGMLPHPQPAWRNVLVSPSYLPPNPLPKREGELKLPSPNWEGEPKLPSPKWDGESKLPSPVRGGVGGEVSRSSADIARDLLGLPNLRAVSIGAGDSALGVLALMGGGQRLITVRGSTDTASMLVDSPRDRTGVREEVLHCPAPCVARITDSPWLAAAPTLRSGKVWDWVKALGGVSDARLEEMAIAALKKRLGAPEGSLEREPLIFDTALGGERAPEWDSRATGTIAGLIESHTLGDIALAALDGLSRRLHSCIRLMEERYDVHPADLVLAGGCARNSLWNGLTQVVTGKRTLATPFADASLVGAAMIGYAAAYDGIESDDEISARLRSLSELSCNHLAVKPVPVGRPCAE